MISDPGWAGSFFTSTPQGIGVRQYWVNVRGVGMGGTGLAIFDPISLANYNVAQWRHIKDTRAFVLFQYSLSRTDFGQLAFASSTGNFGGFTFAVPIKQKKWIVGISLLPYTEVDFNYSQDNSDSEVEYQESIFSRGNLNKAQFSIVWTPHSRLGFSVNGNFYFGTIRDRYQLRFQDPSFFNSSHEIEYRFHGPGVGFSMDFQPSSRIMLGGFVDLRPRLNVSRVYFSPISNEEVDIHGSSHLPIHFGVGSSLRLGSRFMVALDYTQQNWSEGFGIETIPKSILNNWYQIGIGLEHGMLKKPNIKLLNRLDIRGGFSITQLGYKFNDQGVREYAVHFGLGIPFFFFKSRLDLAIKAGIRGDKKKNLVEEKFFKVLISASVGELWFQRPR